MEGHFEPWQWLYLGHSLRFVDGFSIILHQNLITKYFLNILWNYLGHPYKLGKACKDTLDHGDGYILVNFHLILEWSTSNDLWVLICGMDPLHQNDPFASISKNDFFFLRFFVKLSEGSPFNNWDYLGYGGVSVAPSNYKVIFFLAASVRIA